MHVNAKRIALCGMLLALTVICMLLGSIIESNTLFLLAAASYFVGIVIREMGLKTGTAFYIAGVLLGFILAPNKFYVFSYAAMGFYIFMTEVVWNRLAYMNKDYKTRMKFFWLAKYIIFNVIYIPVLVLFPKLFFTGELSYVTLLIFILAGQVVLFIYDKAYDYVQAQVWGKVRHRFMREF